MLFNEGWEQQRQCSYSIEQYKRSHAASPICTYRLYKILLAVCFSCGLLSRSCAQRSSKPTNQSIHQSTMPGTKKLNLKATEVLRSTPEKPTSIKHHCNVDEFLEGVPVCRTAKGQIRGFQRDDTYIVHMKDGHGLVVELEKDDSGQVARFGGKLKQGAIKPALKKSVKLPEPSPEPSGSETEGSEYAEEEEEEDVRAELDQLRQKVDDLTIQIQDLVMVVTQLTPASNKAVKMVVETPTMSEDSADEPSVAVFSPPLPPKSGIKAGKAKTGKAKG
jgi:hypothetical protein